MTVAKTKWSWLGTGGGEMARLMRRTDWAATAVGAVETWSPSLRTVISTLLYARQPMFLWWGPELVQFYNDGYVPSFGAGRHPAALGQRGRECWSEIWPIIGPEIDAVMARGEATFHEDALVPIFRNGRMEEVYWTYGYSPVFEADGSIAGVLVVVTETTSRVVALRRLRTAQVLSEALSLALDHERLAHAVIRSLGSAPEDAPWSLAYRTQSSPGVSALVASWGINDLSALAVVEQVAQQLVTLAASEADDRLRPIDLSRRVPLPGTPWPEASSHAVALPLRAGAGDRAYGYVVLGLSPRLPYDERYAGHVQDLARQLDGACRRIESERARRAAEGARNDLLLQAPVAAALMVGPEWRFELANQLYVRMVGREVFGRTWIDCFPELHGSAVEAILERVYRDGETFVASEQLVPLIRELDGVVEERFFDFNIIPIRSPTDAIQGMMVVAVEMTAQVLARRDLERTAIERESLVRELERTSQAKDEFLAMLGHELRNPLSPMVTALTLMRQHGAGDTRREQAVIARQVTHLSRLVDDLLDVSRVTRGKIELRRATTDVSTVIAHAVEVVGDLFQTRRHDLQVRVEPGLRWHGDATRLEQVIANLLTNAARYTPPGGHVQLAAAGQEHELVVRVADDGQGIHAELLPRIFEPFVQGERGSDRREGGLGLGLAVVKGLIALHGGSVHAQSGGTGLGSEFVVRVPGLVSRPTPGHSEAVEAPPIAPTGLRSRRVLLTDDNEDAADLLAEVLMASGHEVTVAYDGPTALVIAETLRPEVAILDIGLPVMDGYELVRRLSERSGNDKCRYLALTGYGQKEDIERALAAGFERLLIKPVDIDALLRFLRE